MSEEIRESGAQEPQERQYSAVEQEAMAQGWRPKEEFEGDPDRFIEAGEFVRRGELFAKIEDQNRKMKQMNQTLEQFKSHHANVEKAAYDRAIADLKKQRKEALAEGDVEKFDDFDNQIEELKDQRDVFVQRQVQTQTQPQQPPAEFQNWTAKNSWYGNDVIMTGAADRYGHSLAQSNPNLSPLQVLQEVEKMVKKEFPHKFSNPNREKPSAVSAPSTQGTNTKSKYAPSDQERQIAKTFVRAGLYKNESEYYAELEKMEKGS